MQRPLLHLARLFFVVLCLAPFAVMLLRVESADMADLFSARILSLLGRTCLMGLGVATVALVLGGPFGWLVARTNVPGAAILRPLGMVPVLMPPLILAMTWAVIVPDFRGAPATIAFLGLSTSPLVALFVARAAERIDGRLEETALQIGGMRAVLAMELPLLAPAAATGACLAFAFAVNDFGVPDYVSSVGPKFNVYADEIKLNWDQYQRPGLAVASALPLVALVLAALLPALSLRRRGALASLGEGFVQPKTLRLGNWRFGALLFCLCLVAAGTFVPILRLFWEAAAMPQQLNEHDSLLGALSNGGARLVKEFGVALQRARVDLGNSLVYASGAALLCAPIGLILGHGIERARSARMRFLGESLSLLPIASPALLFGIGTIALWNHDATARFYDSGWMAMLLFAGKYLPFAILISAGAVAALGRELEESAALVGASPTRRLVSIVAPSLVGTLVASLVLVFVFAMRDLDAALLVPAANKTVIMRVFNGVHFGRDSYVAALSLLLLFAILLPGILWSLFARKRLEILP
ncbi:MAG: iron(III) transport system permease protein [Planctomycetota bacterium]|jgi:iron(III) transport system permease protein